MKQVYKKKPEYLEVVFVNDDTQSIKDVFEMVEVKTATIGFNDNGERFIALEDGTTINIGMVVFKDKKSGKVIAMPEEKLLQFYDLYVPDKGIEQDPKEKKRNVGLQVSDGRGIGGEVEE